MTVTGWIIAGLLIALFGVLAVGGMFLNHERIEHQLEKERVKKEWAENAQHTADIIKEANADLGEFRADNCILPDMFE